MKKIYSLFALTFLICCSSVIRAQSLKGVIIDAKNETLPGVVVKDLTTGVGAASSIDGSYTLNLKEGPHKIEFVLLGYVTQVKDVVIPATGSLTLNITLEEDSKMTEEVVVVGYGVQRKRDVTGSISKVEGKELTRFPTPSFEAALQGQAAGVQVTQGSGLAGSGSQVRVRGIASVSAGGDPLYVVDGIPITQDQFLRGSEGGMNTNPLATINPNDIASIEVLKDAAATGIYGSRGANGVILITTKRASTKGFEVSYTTRFGAGVAATLPNMMNTQQYLAMRQEAWENDGNTGYVWLPNLTGATASPQAREEAYLRALGTNTDWVKETAGTGFKMLHTIGISNKTEKNGLYVGLTYDRNGSYLLGNSYTRQSVRVNWDHEFSKKLKLVTGVNYTRGINKRVSAAWNGGFGEAMSTALPYFPVYNPDGTYYTWNNGYSNPVMWREERPWEYIEDRALINIGLNYAIKKDLNLRYTANIDGMRGADYQFEPKDLTPGLTAGSIARTSTVYVPNVNSNLTLDYMKTFKEKHNFTFLLGGEGQTARVYDRFEEYRNALGLWYDRDNRSAGENEPEVTRINFNKTTQRESSVFISGFARVNYNYMNKYFVQVVGRSDGSSKFGTNNKVGYFPSASAGWIISDEKFMKGKTTLSFLKLRAGWGKVGNANVPQNAQFADRTIAGTYIGQPILYTTKLPNPDLKWEVSTTTDLALDFGLFKDRITGTIGVYRKMTVDAILDVSIPGSTGFGSYTDNVAEILNQGFEVSITSNNVVTKNFLWKTNVNFARNYNELVSIGEYTPDAVSGGTNDTRVVPKEPLGSYYMMDFSHVDPENGRPVFIDSKGNYTYTYSNLERVNVGNGLPKFSGGIRNDFSYKNWTASIFATFSLGAMLYDHSGKNQMGILNNWNLRTDLFDRWRQPGDDAAFPILTFDPATYGQTRDDFNTTDLFLYKADFLRIKNIEVGYTFDIKNRKYLKSLRVTANATNLFTFTNFPGLDPEVARDFSNGTDRNLSPNVTYLTPPQEKSFNIGLSATF